jgi:hypothetical protein
MSSDITYAFPALIKWVSGLLKPSGIKVTRGRDFKSGVAFLRLAESLFPNPPDPSLYDAEPTTEVEMLRNQDYFLRFIASSGVVIHGITGTDLLLHDRTWLSRLLSQLFLNCVIEDVADLLEWARRRLGSFDIPVKDWTSSWSDGHGLLTLANLAAEASGRSVLKVTEPVRGRHDRENAALQIITKLKIPIYASEGDITEHPTAIVIQMQVWALHQFIDKAEHPWRFQGRRHPEPKCNTNYSIGIDLGSTKVRYGIYKKDQPNAPVAVSHVENCVSFSIEGEIKVGSDPSWLNFAPVPSCQRFIGRMFNDPAIADAVRSYPLPMSEDPELKTCAISIGAGLPTLTPEGIVTRVLSKVRRKAEKAVGESVVDASIAVPALFTDAQRRAVRDAAESAGFCVAHIISGTLASAIALKQSRRYCRLRGDHTFLDRHPTYR